MDAKELYQKAYLSGDLQGLLEKRLAFARRWKALAKRLFQGEVLASALDARAVWHDKAQQFWDRVQGAELCAALLAGAVSEGDRRAAIEAWGDHCKLWGVKGEDIQAAPFINHKERHDRI